MTRFGKAIIVGVVALLVVGAILFVTTYGRARVPEQPIKFNHKIHAGDYKIPCGYCHVYARRNAVAGIPSAERCMGCHKITAANNPEVQKLQKHRDQKQPIQWIKVTSMPDYVFFEHWPHIRADIKCQTCHGPIETMEETRPSALTMSECLDCHRKEKASIDCMACHR